MTSRRVCLVAYLFIVAALLQGATARTTHIVGGSIGWTVPPPGFSYDTWAASQTFMVGDMLFFNFTSTSQEDVAEAMAKSAYDSCITVAIFRTYVSTTNILIASAGEHYYFSTIGQRCEMNQKLAINVSSSHVVPASSTNSSSYSTSTSSTSSLTVAHFSLLLLSTVVAFFY